jgi:hypothetical protein
MQSKRFSERVRIYNFWRTFPFLHRGSPSFCIPPSIDVPTKLMDHRTYDDVRGAPRVLGRDVEGPEPGCEKNRVEA